MREGVKQLFLTFCQFVILSVLWKFLQTGLNDSKTDSCIDIVKKVTYVYVPHKEQSGSTLCISSSFLFNVVIVHHFNMVNTLDMVESG